MFPTILFFIFATVLVCAALGVILARNPGVLGAAAGAVLLQ